MNAITTDIAAQHVAAAPVFVLFILDSSKREEPIATNSMIRHEVYCAARLEEAGFAAAYFEGGIEQWIAEPHPTTSESSRSQS